MDEDLLLSTLLKLAYNNEQFVNQMIQQAEATYPNKSRRWHLEKILYDIRWRRAVSVPQPEPKPQPPLKKTRWGIYGVIINSPRK